MCLKMQHFWPQVGHYVTGVGLQLLDSIALKINILIFLTLSHFLILV